MLWWGVVCGTADTLELHQQLCVTCLGRMNWVLTLLLVVVCVADS